MYDTKCKDLAEAFLEDDRPTTREERATRAHGLAQAIQDAIEGWLEDNPLPSAFDEELNRLDS